MSRNRRSLTRINSFLNREWGRVKGLRKRKTGRRRRQLNKRVIFAELQEIA